MLPLSLAGSTAVAGCLCRLERETGTVSCRQAGTTRYADALEPSCYAKAPLGLRNQDAHQSMSGRVLHDSYLSRLFSDRVDFLAPHLYVIAIKCPRWWTRNVPTI